MNIVIDTNIFISALIKEGLIRAILINSNLNFLFPEFEYEEIYNNREEIMKKSNLNEKELDILILRLTKNVKIIPKSMVVINKNESEKIMENIDPNDVQFIATALTFNCSIWSDDKHFKKQNVVKTYNTKEIIELLKK